MLTGPKQWDTGWNREKAMMVKHVSALLGNPFNDTAVIKFHTNAKIATANKFENTCARKTHEHNLPTQNQQ